jgi:hypothetical protein
MRGIGKGISGTSIALWGTGAAVGALVSTKGSRILGAIVGAAIVGSVGDALLDSGYDVGRDDQREIDRGDKER